MKPHSSSAEPYVCAFRGRRDYYQLPLALAEANRLDRFITDAYATPALDGLAGLLPSSIRDKIRFRKEPGIPPALVSCLWGTTAREILRHRLGYSRYLTYATLDADFSKAAAARAAKTRSHLFLYHPYAWEAFNTSYPHDPRKVLFQFHPHPDLEESIIADDLKRFPSAENSMSGDIIARLPEALRRRESDCWQQADLIVCASSFTKRSLVEAGAEQSRCVVIPYGIDSPVSSSDGPGAGSFQAVFVGTGIQRKGLHHLLLAWQKANLPADSKLTLVCRSIDSEIEKLAAQTPRVEIVRGISQEGRDELFMKSSLFVMPSLVEGFGQVYLEALSCGLPVLGTTYTALPDLGDESDGVYLAEAGNIDDLVATLERLSKLLPGNREIRAKARSCAGRFPWRTFRDKIREIL